MKKPIHLVVPEADLDMVEEFNINPKKQAMLITPEGADPMAETPGFFIIQIDGECIWSDIGDPDKRLPKQFLSLDAVHAFLRDTYGWGTPLRVTSYMRIEEGGAKDFPVIWGADRKLKRKRVRVRVRYLGSFRWWSGRRVDPTTLGSERRVSAARYVH